MTHNLFYNVLKVSTRGQTVLPYEIKSYLANSWWVWSKESDSFT